MIVRLGSPSKFHDRRDMLRDFGCGGATGVGGDPADDAVAGWITDRQLLKHPDFTVAGIGEGDATAEQPFARPAIGVLSFRSSPSSIIRYFVEVFDWGPVRAAPALVCSSLPPWRFRGSEGLSLGLNTDETVKWRLWGHFHFTGALEMCFRPRGYRGCRAVPRGQLPDRSGRPSPVRQRKSA